MTKSDVNYIDIGRDGEVISNSALAFRFNWPDIDPRSLTQPQQTYDDGWESILYECVGTRRLDWNKLQKQLSGKPIHEQIFEILNHRSIQFNSRSRYKESEIWLERLKIACKHGRKIEIVLPIFCVIRNPAKRFDFTQPTSAEIITLRHLHHISNLVRGIYAQGVLFHLVADSTFYSLPFGVTAVEAFRYVALLREKISEYNLCESIQMHDMSEIMAAQFSDFQNSFEYWYTKFSSDELTGGLIPDPVDGDSG